MFGNLTMWQNVMLSTFLNLYWQYKGDFSTAYEDVDHSQLLQSMMNDEPFWDKVFEALRGIPHQGESS